MDPNMKSGPEFEFRAFQKLSDQTSDLDHRKTQTKTYILGPGSGLFSFLLSSSLSASKAWMRILSALVLLFAELKLCQVSKWARSSAQGLQWVLHAGIFSCFIKCPVFITEEEEDSPWLLWTWLLRACFHLLGDLYYNPRNTEK